MPTKTNQMKKSKQMYDAIFLVISTLILMAIIKLDLPGNYMGFAIIPLLISYQLGRYVERKFKD